MANIKLKDHNWHASGIIDTNQNKDQATVNSDVSTKMGSASLQTVSQNLSGGINELKGRVDTNESKVDNLVTVSNSQPSSQYNKVWLPLTVSEGTQVPTWAEHQTLNTTVSNLQSDLNDIDPFHGSLPNNTDLNDVTTAGFYWLGGTYTYTNRPSVVGYGLLEVSRSSPNSSAVIQKIYYSTRVNNQKTTYSPIFMRFWSGSSWYDWVRYSGNDGITCDTAIAIPASGSSVAKDLSGLTSVYQLVRWNFSSSPENCPPVNLTWTTYSGYFTITNNGGTTSETIKPMFVRAETKEISNHS